MQIIDLFSGIGGFSLAGHGAGWETICFCEIDPFCQTVLKSNYPGIPVFDNVKTLTREKIENETRWNPNEPTIVVGGFPCQPYSTAGQRKGTDDPRHLWPEMLRIIQEISPYWVVGENVFGITNWSGGLVFESVQVDLENSGYEVQPIILPAAGINAPHQRDRVWFVAHRSDARVKSLRERQNEIYEIGLTTYSNSRERKKRGDINGEWENETENRTGLDNRLTGFSINAITPDPDQFNGNLSGLRASEISQLDPSEILENTTPDPGLLGQTERSIDPMGTEQLRKKRDVANTCNTGLRGRKFDGAFEPGYRPREPREPTSQLHKTTDWSNFPTQSPVRGRNDGIPAGLVRGRIRRDCMGLLSEKEIDRIVSKAVTKLNNESIKAYGNAIVHQVALQIFRSINQYEQLEK